MTTKVALYRLIDAIPADELEAARRALEPLADPVLLALANAPLDDEPETDEERQAVAEGRSALCGRSLAWGSLAKATLAVCKGAIVGVGLVLTLVARAQATYRDLQSVR